MTRLQKRLVSTKGTSLIYFSLKFYSEPVFEFSEEMDLEAETDQDL